MRRPKIYAYVTTETCKDCDAVRPGHEVTEGRPVSKHGDYFPWLYGKRDTLAIIAERSPWTPSRHTHECARQVALLLGWL